MPRSQVEDRHDLRQSRTVLLATDKQSSVIAKLAGDKPGAIAYTAYGQQSAQQQVVVGLGFNGELCEARLGWYLLGNGYRAYNPTLMRFHSPDSLSPFGKGGLNSYMYCLGDPINLRDPNGESPIFSKFFSNRSAEPTYSKGSSQTFHYKKLVVLKETKTLTIEKSYNNGYVTKQAHIENDFKIKFYNTRSTYSEEASNLITFEAIRRETNPSLFKLTYNSTLGKEIKQILKTHPGLMTSEVDASTLHNLATISSISNEMQLSAVASIKHHKFEQIVFAPSLVTEKLVRDIRSGSYYGINPNNI